MKISKPDVIYPCRIPRDVFKQLRQVADERDLSASQVIRFALREMLKQRESKTNSEDGKKVVERMGK